MGAVSAYQVGGVHRHTPEIEQAFAVAAGRPAAVSFTPLLAPMPRGILATCTARLASRAPGAPGPREVLAAAYGGRALRPPAARGALAQHRGHRRIQRRAPPGGRR